jgi:DNA-binding CsgD family transcriptional regulator
MNQAQPPGKPVAFDLATLRNFSHCLMSMTSAPREVNPERLLRNALQSLRLIVPFRSAWWGECSTGMTNLPPRNWMHGHINLSASFSQDWNSLAERDEFARGSMRQLDAVMRMSGHDDPWPEMSAFSRQHDLYHVMALTKELPGSGLMFFVSLYRGETSPAFSDNESALFAEFVAHLQHHWRVRVREFLGHPGIPSSDGFGLADCYGDLFYLDKRLGVAIHKAYPDWVGSRLPLELVTALRQIPSAISLDGRGLTLHPCGDLVVLSLDGASGRDVLTPRERSVAMLYSRGHAYKEIARLLTLSPATVRTYLRNAYLQLGVRNKIELGVALQMPAAQR